MSERRGVAAEGSAIDFKVTNRQIRGNAIIDTEGQSSGLEVIAGRIIGAVNIRELADARDPNTPTVLWRRRHNGQAALALRPAYAGKAAAEARRVAVQREARCAEAVAARANVLHTPLQICGLHICE